MIEIQILSCKILFKPGEHSTLGQISVTTIAFSVTNLLLKAFSIQATKSL